VCETIYLTLTPVVVTLTSKLVAQGHIGGNHGDGNHSDSPQRAAGGGGGNGGRGGISPWTALLMRAFTACVTCVHKCEAMKVKVNAVLPGVLTWCQEGLEGRQVGVVLVNMLSAGLL